MLSLTSGYIFYSLLGEYNESNQIMYNTIFVMFDI